MDNHETISRRSVDSSGPAALLPGPSILLDGGPIITGASPLPGSRRQAFGTGEWSLSGSQKTQPVLTSLWKKNKKKIHMCRAGVLHGACQDCAQYLGSLMPVHVSQKSVIASPGTWQLPKEMLTSYKCPFSLFVPYEFLVASRVFRLPYPDFVPT